MFFEEMFGGGHPGMRGGPSSREPVDTDELYNTLNVEKNATEKQIRKAWRKLAKKHHPDRGGDTEVFKKCEAAYEVLSDSTKRELYDQGGMEAVQHGGIPGPTNIFDLFTGGQRQRATGPSKPEPIKHVMSLDLEDCYEGPSKEITVKILTATERQSCERCNGRGQYMETVRRGHMILQSQRTCPECGGRGQAFVGERTVEKKIEIFVPAGCRDGDKQVLDGEGHDLPDMPTGDVIVIFKIKKHSLYIRKGADLCMQKQLSLVEALCGFDFTVKSIMRGDWLRIKSQDGHVTQHSEVMKIANQGLPQKGNRSRRGNLYVSFKVVLPRSIPNNSQDPLCELLSRENVSYTMPGKTKNNVGEITQGSRIRLIGLSNRPELNGSCGIVLPVPARQGQIICKLDTEQTIAVPPQYLELESPPEPAPEEEEVPGADDFIDEVSGEPIVDFDRVSHTPAEHGKASAYDEDEEQEGVSCRQM